MGRLYLCNVCDVEVQDSRYCEKHLRKPKFDRRNNTRSKKPNKFQANQTWKERKHKEAAVKWYIDNYGYVCSGYDRPSHPSKDLTADHIVPKFMGGNPLGRLRILCRSCNSRRGAKMKANFGIYVSK